VTIPTDAIDRELPAKLMREADGILSWAVGGAVRWYRDGLGHPNAVEQAGREWRTDMDQLGRFLEECCVRGDYASVRARALYSAYKRWADEAGEHAITETAFSNALGDRNLTKRHTDRGAVYQNIGLKQDHES
jgi:putative DNA primase/helicase